VCCCTDVVCCCCTQVLVLMYWGGVLLVYIISHWISHVIEPPSFITWHCVGGLYASQKRCNQTGRRFSTKPEIMHRTSFSRQNYVNTHSNMHGRTGPYHQIFPNFLLKLTNLGAYCIPIFTFCGLEGQSQLIPYHSQKHVSNFSMSSSW
jgi:hypothetical protein